MLTRISCCAALLLLASSPLMAVPVLWTLSGVTLSDGGTVTGSFVYDATTNTFSSVNVATSGGAVAPHTFIAPHPSIGNASVIALVTQASGDLTGTEVIVLNAVPALSNAGGTRTLTPSAVEGTCSNPGCTSAPANRSLTAGILTGTAISTSFGAPALSWPAMMLLILLLAGTAFFALRRSERANNL